MIANFAALRKRQGIAAALLTHAYDAVGNRSGLTHGPDAVIVDGAWSYLHDGNGNLKRVTTPATDNIDLFYDPANRLRADDTTCYDYDANGNLVTKRVKVGLDCTDTSGAATTYEWDVLNRLVRIDNPDGSFAAYRYDAQGRRIEKDVNGSITRYVYDGDAIVLEYDGADVLQARYTHGEVPVSAGPLPQGPRGAAGAGSKIRRCAPGAIPPRGPRPVGGRTTQPLAMARGGVSYFYGVDHLGSVRLVTDASGAVANSYDYDAFGNLEATSFETVSNPFGFTARERDAESGLMFYRARYYDPKLGRFISQDPIGFEGEDLNLYRYVFNNPLILTDSFGQTAMMQIGAWVHARYRKWAETYAASSMVWKMTHNAYIAGAAGGLAGGVKSDGDACLALRTAIYAAAAAGLATAISPGPRAGFGAFATIMGLVYLKMACTLQTGLAQALAA